MLLGVFLPGCTWNHVYDSPVEGCSVINSAVCIGHEACVSEFGTNVSCRGRCWLKGGLPFVAQGKGWVRKGPVLPPLNGLDERTAAR